MGQKENFKWSIDFKQECWISFSTNICFEVKNHYIEDEIEIFCPFSKRQELVFRRRKPAASLKSTVGWSDAVTMGEIIGGPRSFLTCLNAV